MVISRPIHPGPFKPPMNLQSFPKCRHMCPKPPSITDHYATSDSSTSSSFEDITHGNGFITTSTDDMETTCGVQAAGNVTDNIGGETTLYGDRHENSCADVVLPVELLDTLAPYELVNAEASDLYPILDSVVSTEAEVLDSCPDQEV